MQIVSTNIGEPREIEWSGKMVRTGIYKYPVSHSLFLGKTDVKGDHVIDRRYHGGEDKAFYVYGSNHYPFWKEQYSQLEWSYGMFGENLTVDAVDESNLFIGSTYAIGEATVQVVQPRQPCFKLGVRFEDPGILKKFISSGYSGVYFSVVKEGKVVKGDTFKLLKEDSQQVSILDLFQAIFFPVERRKLEKIVTHQVIPEGMRAYLAKKLNP